MLHSDLGQLNRRLVTTTPTRVGSYYRRQRFDLVAVGQPHRQQPLVERARQGQGFVGLGCTLFEQRLQQRPVRVAEAVVYMAGLPLDTNVQFMTIMATKMPFVGRG